MVLLEHAVISRVNDFNDLQNIDLKGDFRVYYIAADSQIKPTYICTFSTTTTNWNSSHQVVISRPYLLGRDRGRPCLRGIAGNDSQPSV
jgi:hypothetical protein